MKLSNPLGNSFGKTVCYSHLHSLIGIFQLPKIFFSIRIYSITLLQMHILPLLLTKTTKDLYKSDYLVI